MIAKKIIVVLDRGKCSGLYNQLKLYGYKLNHNTFAFSTLEGFEHFKEATKNVETEKKYLVIEPYDNDPSRSLEAEIVLPC